MVAAPVVRSSLTGRLAWGVVIATLITTAGCSDGGPPETTNDGLDLVELTADQTRDMVGQYTDPDDISDFWAPSLHDTMASKLRELDVVDATAKALSNDTGYVRVLVLDFRNESDASAFVIDPTVANDPAVPVCTTPEGRPAGCATYSDSARTYWRAVVVDKRAKRVSIIVSEDPSKDASLLHIDDVAMSLGLPPD